MEQKRLTVQKAEVHFALKFSNFLFSKKSHRQERRKILWWQGNHIFDKISIFSQSLTLKEFSSSAEEETSARWIFRIIPCHLPSIFPYHPSNRQPIENDAVQDGCGRLG